MKNLNISVVDKIAKYLQRDGAIVCGNSDYQITFTFDSEWDAYPTKTARFIWNGKYWDQPFSGNVCPVPKITNAVFVLVGVYAGDLSTTTPASIPCKRSILCDDVEINDGCVEGLTEQAVEAAYRAEVAAARVEAILSKFDNVSVLGYVDENNNIILTGSLPETTYIVKYEMEDGTTLDIGELDFDGSSGGDTGGSGGTVAYNVTNKLTNCKTSNTDAFALEGGSYSATITANDGYELSSVVVTMGGNPVTVSNGIINISNVTGDITITAVATETPTEQPTSLFVIGGDGYITNGRCSSTGEDRTNNNGYIVTNYIDIKNGDTVYIKNASISTVTNGYSGMKLTDGTTIGLYPNTSEYIINYSENNGITQFTINKADADYIRITLVIYTDGKSATEERVSELGIIITVNEPIV